MNVFARITQAVAVSVGKLRAFFRAHATVSVIVFLILAVFIIVWARLGFSMDFSRFFASEELNCDDGDACTADHPDPASCGPGGCTACANDPIPNCPHGECSNNTCISVETSGTSQCSSNADCAPPPPATVCGNGVCESGEEETCADCDEQEGRKFSMHFAGFHASTDGLAYFDNPTFSDESGTYCVYEMINGDFNNQVELGRKLVTVKKRSNKTVPLSDVYAGCGSKILQLDLVYAYDACGEAPSGHAGSVWDFVIGFPYNGGACPTHSECSQQNTCIAVDGAGTNTCTTDADCAAPTHLECSQQNTCVAVAGAGANTCTTDADCATPTHLECSQQNTCVSVAGAGTNTCTTDSDCATPTHLECSQQNTCVTVAGAGANTCATNADCVTTTHLVCSEQRTCVSVQGPGANQCDSDSDCATPTHLECSAQSTCVSVSGAGNNECDSDADCRQPAALSCEPGEQNARTGETVRIRAIGGTGPFIWAAADSSRLETDGAVASVRFSRTGRFPVSVQDGTAFDVCYVTVTKPPGGGGGRPSTPALEIVKLVRNVTLGISERDIVPASPSNTLEFMLEVTSTGEGTAYGVVVRDTLPDRTTYVPGSTTIDDVAAPDGITGAGISLGDMKTDAVKVIRFRVTLASTPSFTYATTILTNTGCVRGSGVTEVCDMAHVTLSKGRPITQIRTGPGETTVLALIIASIITLLYVGYTGTDAFRRRELQQNIDVARRDKNQFNFKK